LVLALIATTPRLASAHTRLVQSDPPKRAALTAGPKSVRLWFNEPVEPSFVHLSVSDAAGQKLSSDAPKVDPTDPKILELTVPELAAGAYTVNYEVLSVDGHRVKGAFSFTVKGPVGAHR
jgi:methionine-rich copper-binding protein CopC